MRAGEVRGRHLQLRTDCSAISFRAIGRPRLVAGRHANSIAVCTRETCPGETRCRQLLQRPAVRMPTACTRLPRDPGSRICLHAKSSHVVATPVTTLRSVTRYILQRSRMRIGQRSRQRASRPLSSSTPRERSRPMTISNPETDSSFLPNCTSMRTNLRSMAGAHRELVNLVPSGELGARPGQIGKHFSVSSRIFLAVN